jgi:hypothetical protein
MHCKQYTVTNLLQIPVPEKVPYYHLGFGDFLNGSQDKKYLQR